MNTREDNARAWQCCTFLPLNTSSEIDLVSEREFCNRCPSLNNSSVRTFQAQPVKHQTFERAAAHSGEMFATSLVWAGGGGGAAVVVGGGDPGSVVGPADPGKH